MRAPLRPRLRNALCSRSNRPYQSPPKKRLSSPPATMSVLGVEESALPTPRTTGDAAIFAMAPPPITRGTAEAAPLSQSAMFFSRSVAGTGRPMASAIPFPGLTSPGSYPKSRPTALMGWFRNVSGISPSPSSTLRVPRPRPRLNSSHRAEAVSRHVPSGSAACASPGESAPAPVPPAKSGGRPLRRVAVSDMLDPSETPSAENARCVAPPFGECEVVGWTAEPSGVPQTAGPLV